MGAVQGDVRLLLPDIQLKHPEKREQIMPNIPYASNEIIESDEARELLEAIKARRGGKLFNLDRMLLHSPPFAEGWNTLFQKVHNDLSLDSKLQEIAIVAVCVANGSYYEVGVHVPVFHMVGGTPDQINALYNIDTAVNDVDNFNAAERAVIRLSIEMTRDVKPKSETLEAVKAVLPGTRQVMEVISVVAAYNMTSRIILTTGVETEE